MSSNTDWHVHQPDNHDSDHQHVAPIAATIYMTSHLATDWHDHHSTTQYRDHQHPAQIPRVRARVRLRLRVGVRESRSYCEGRDVFT